MLVRKLELPYEAAFVAGKANLRYRRSDGKKRSPLPGFYIGARAAVSRLTLLTRDASRYRTYFLRVKLIAPGMSSRNCPARIPRSRRPEPPGRTFCSPFGTNRKYTRIGNPGLRRNSPRTMSLLKFSSAASKSMDQCSMLARRAIKRSRTPCGSK